MTSTSLVRLSEFSNELRDPWKRIAETSSQDLTLSGAGFPQHSQAIAVTTTDQDWDLAPPMSLGEMDQLMTLDSEHNPLLAELWHDDINDDLLDNP